MTIPTHIMKRLEAAKETNELPDLDRLSNSRLGALSVIYSTGQITEEDHNSMLDLCVEWIQANR